VNVIVVAHADGEGSIRHKTSKPGEANLSWTIGEVKLIMDN